MENEKCEAIGILSGDIYPNSSSTEGVIGINARNLFIKEEYRGFGFAQMLLSKIFTVIPKNLGGINLIITGLSTESVMRGNLNMYKHLANKSNLTIKVEGKEKGVYFSTVLGNCSYEMAKDISKKFRIGISIKHSLDISKTPERKGWKF